jgi:hypothetical protein
VTPEDDPTWPRCIEHSEKHWCNSLRGFLIESGDCGGVEPGLRYCVPVAPELDIYAEVSIDSESMANGTVAMMWLVQPNGTPSDPFGLTQNETLHSLGMWTRGEGRLVMASAVKDWVAANTVPKCDQTSHGFEQEITLQKLMRDADNKFIRANEWCLAFYEMCYVCFGATGGAASPTVFGPDNFTADQFGLGSDNFTPAREQSTRSQGQQNRTRDLLQQRFGN